MTYLGFLGLFLIVPLIGLVALTLVDARRRPRRFAVHAAKPAAIALLIHVLLAVAYTTPWDNYLVATGVWWYDPARVLGLTLGWVPLEEYLFFVLQTLFTGLVLFALARRLPAPAFRPSRSLRVGAVLVVAVLWLVSVAILAAGWRPGTYLGLELVWALPPIAHQLAVGADILWRHRRRVGLALAGVTLYLCAADFLAIGAGVWTIDPAQSLNLFLGGTLPVEEVIFFLLTNTLLVFGLTLSLAPETWQRWAHFKASLARREPLRDSV
jgi:lycopene cyclase domain-containing protein